jgi:hypothetical protein
MKHFNKILFIFTFCALLFSCEDDDATITQKVQIDAERGAVLRTMELEGTTLDANNLSTAFRVVVQAQDILDGDLLQSVDVFASFTDRTPENGTTPSIENLFSTIPASEFSTDEFGLLQAEFSITLQELSSFLSITAGNGFTGGDRFSIRLALNLTDGRTFTFGDAASNVATGSFFRSPFNYVITVACIPLTPIFGIYTFELSDSFGDGWDGAFLTVNIDGVTQELTIDGSSGSFDVTVPEGTTTFEITYTPGSFEEEHTFKIFLNDDEEVVSAGPAPAPGLVFLNVRASCPN